MSDELRKKSDDIAGVKARNKARREYHAEHPAFSRYSAEAFMRAVDDCDALIAMIEGEPTALEKGASVEDVMRAFEDNYAGILES